MTESHDYLSENLVTCPTMMNRAGTQKKEKALNMSKNSKSKLWTLELIENFQSNESYGYMNWFSKVLDTFFSFYQQNIYFPSDIILKKQALIKRL